MSCQQIPELFFFRVEIASLSHKTYVDISFCMHEAMTVQRKFLILALGSNLEPCFDDDFFK